MGGDRVTIESLAISASDTVANLPTVAQDDAVGTVALWAKRHGLDHDTVVDMCAYLDLDYDTAAARTRLHQTVRDLGEGCEQATAAFDALSAAQAAFRVRKNEHEARIRKVRGWKK